MTDLVKNWFQKDCHKDGAFVFNLGKARIHAGSYHAADNEPWGLVINLRGDSNWSVNCEPRGQAVKICSGFVGSMPRQELPAELCIDWPDGGVPAVRRKDWRRLVADLQRFDGKVLVHCMGGHGRTGTLLVTLAVLGDIVPKKKDPVEWIRENYCKKVVESQAQISYLKKNINVITTAEPRYLATSTVHSYGGGYGGSVSGWNDYYKGKDDRWDTHESPLAISGIVSHPPVVIEAKAELPHTIYRCNLCGNSKMRASMQIMFADGSGQCYLCLYKLHHGAIEG